jgi:Api92-like protein with ferredoxin domain
MLNWCENILVVSGEDDDIERFKRAVQPAGDQEAGGPTALSLEKLCPVPDEIKRLVIGGAANRRDWVIAHWGTTWDVEASLVFEDEGCLEYVFDSAWAPPLAWLEYAFQTFPCLRFRLKYDEPGQGFMGVATAEGGIVHDACLDY